MLLGGLDSVSKPYSTYIEQSWGHRVCLLGRVWSCLGVSWTVLDRVGRLGRSWVGLPLLMFPFAPPLDPCTTPPERHRSYIVVFAAFRACWPRSTATSIPPHTFPSYMLFYSPLYPPLYCPSPHTFPSYLLFYSTRSDRFVPPYEDG